MSYRADLDGLRAVAVVSVILFHAGVGVFSGGYVGVDVFFVISGYLITTLLVEDARRGQFSLVHFYQRRARRILPALVLVSLVSTAAAWVFMSPVDLERFGNNLIGVATFLSNVVFWQNQGYFSESSELNPLLHTWSLAVEEQYYVLFPLLLMLVWRFGRRRLFYTLALAAACSLLLSEWGSRYSPSANFYLAPTRAWELFAGSLAALFVQARGLRTSNLASLAGLAAIGFAVFVYDQRTPFPGLYTLVPVIGTVAVVVCSGPGTFVAKLLGSRVPVGIGLISYSLYLWHQPLFAFYRLYAKTIVLPDIAAATLVSLSFLLACLSWKFIERPFRRRGSLSTKAVFGLSLLSLNSLVVLGLLSRQPAAGYEFLLAETLSESDYVYYANLDDRRFVESRLALPLKPIDTLVMGSSRMMQIGSEALETSTLNVSLSGASVEDYIAFVGESTAKLRPKRVLLGADPWLFNEFHGQERWRSSEPLFSYWSEKIKNGWQLENPDTTGFLKGNPDRLSPGPVHKIYGRLNKEHALVPADGGVEAVSKKAYDGRHIYNEQTHALSDSDIEQGIDQLLSYSMVRYRHDGKARQAYVDLLQWLLLNAVEVHLVLSPYHPAQYEKMVKERPVYLALEQDYRALARRLGIGVAGSYDPRRVGCKASEFYDGMHPDEDCVSRLLKSFRVP